MKVAILGYGKMGRLLAKMLEARGDEVILRVDIENRDSVTDEQLREADVAMEFSLPSAAVDNYKWCFDCGVPVVSGTTGWLSRMEEVKEYCRAKNGGFFYASNFSIGMNIFFKLNRMLAGIMSNFPAYKVSIDELHHRYKIDAPSGTAITLAEGLIAEHRDYEGWDVVERDEDSDLCVGDPALCSEASGGEAQGSTVATAEAVSQAGGSTAEEPPVAPGTIRIVSRRRGEELGTHEVFYNAPLDGISLKHYTYSRESFAMGAIAAADFLCGKRGIYSMDDLVKI